MVRRLEQSLADAGLETYPPFTQTWIDNKIALVTATELGRAGTAEASGGSAEIGIKVALLPSANCEVVAVSPQDRLEKAISLMQLYDYSQLAVVSGAHTLKGAVTWQSIAACKIKSQSPELSDAMQLRPVEVDYDEDLIAVIPRIVGPGFAFVRGPDNSISGIVTMADIGIRFAQIAEPFLVLEELERRLRAVIDRCFSLGEIQAAANPNDQRSIEGADDLTIGDIARLIGQPANFAKLPWVIDRQIFVKALGEVRSIRNDLVHFSPDPLEESQVHLLHNVVRWLRELTTDR